MSTTKELLIEIGCEELPTWAVRLVLDHLKAEIPKVMAGNELTFTKLQLMGTPRRIVVMLDGVPERQADRTELITGPPRRTAFDDQGRPTKAALGFAAKCGVEVPALHVVKIAKGEYLAHERHVEGRNTGALVGEALPVILAGIQFRKPMYWAQDRYVFIRPIRWVLALFGTSVVPIKIAGIGSGNKTQGHRLLGQRDIIVNHRQEYLQALRSHYVVLDPAERRRIIAGQLAETAKDLGGRVHPDEELLDEVTFLNEYPHVIYGSIPEEFLNLPGEVLTTVMRKHQKYFSVEDHGGKILPYFLAVLDIDQDQQGIIRRGHERVLQARLNDASFFWRVDGEKPLESRLPSLRNYQFHVKLGSYLEKTQRIQALCGELLTLLGRTDLSSELSQASLLAKADLATEMVKELTELQGVMGGLYARREGLPEAVCQAIYDHYLPRNLEEASPRTLQGAILSIADRADTLAGCFGVGMAPKGSSDPFALRRHAQGLVKILWDHRLPLSLTAIMKPAFQGVTDKMSLSLAGASEELTAFLERRIRHMLQQRVYSYDVINAVVAIGFDQPLQVLERAAAVQKIRPEPDFEAIATAFKRVKNILGEKARADELLVSEQLLVEEAEKRLHASFRRAAPQAEDLTLEGKYYEALKSMATLRPAVDLFFDKVLVMSPDTRLRSNRLALLKELSALFMLVADISEIVVEGSGSLTSTTMSSWRNHD